MTVLLGLWFSFGVGVSDYHGGWLARRTNAISTVATAFIAGTAVAGVLMLVVDSSVTLDDGLLGVASGSTMGFALAALYRGIGESSAAVVAPIGAVLATVIPFGWDLATGGTLAALGVLGAVVALAGLALTTFSPELGDRIRVGVGWGVVAGLCFGSSLVFLGETAEDSGLWPAVVQRATGLIVLLIVTIVRGLPPLVEASFRPRAAFSGAIGATGIAAFAVGAQQGSLAEIAIATALAPAVTAGLAAVFDGHPMRWWQMLGAGVCAAGVAMIGAS